MFHKVFQGGPHVEVFVASGRDAENQCKFHGPAASVKKEFSKPLKSYVYHFEGDSTVTKLQLPKADKQTLGLVQPFCVLQVNIPTGASLAIDLCVCDVGGNRRRVLLSTSLREVVSTPLHAKVPLSELPRDQWMNLSVNLHSLVTGLFKTQGLKTLDSLVVGGTFQLRRIFTLKSQPPGSHVPPGEFSVDPIPKCCTLADASTVVIAHSSVRTAGGDLTARSQASSSSSTATSRQPALGGERADSGRTTHIAFGRRVEVPRHALRARQQVDGVEDLSHLPLPESRESLLSVGEVAPGDGESTKNPLVGQSINPQPPKVPPSRGLPVRLPKQRLKSVSKAKRERSNTTEQSNRRETVPQSTIVQVSAERRLHSRDKVVEVESDVVDPRQLLPAAEALVSGKPYSSTDYPEYNAEDYQDQFVSSSEKRHVALHTPSTTTANDTLVNSSLLDNLPPSHSHRDLHSGRPTTVDEERPNGDDSRDAARPTSSDHSQNIIFQYCSPPKQYASGGFSPDRSFDHTASSHHSPNTSRDGHTGSRQDNLDGDFVSVGSDIHPHSQSSSSRQITLPLAQRRTASREKRDASCGVDVEAKETSTAQDVSLMRLSKIYDWRQYQSGDNNVPSSSSSGPALSIEARLAVAREAQLLASQPGLSPDPPPGDTSTSDSADQDNSLANTMTMTMTWDDKLRPFATPMLDSLELRESLDRSSPPMASRVGPFPNEEVGVGWNSDKAEEDNPGGVTSVSGPPEDEDVELMYDPTLECFYDPKTCKYYVLQ